MIKELTLGNIQVTEVTLLKVEIETAEGSTDPVGTATVMMKTSNPNFPKVGPLKMIFVPDEKFLRNVIQEVVQSANLTKHKHVLPAK